MSNPTPRERARKALAEAQNVRFQAECDGKWRDADDRLRVQEKQDAIAWRTLRAIADEPETRAEAEPCDADGCNAPSAWRHESGGAIWDFCDAHARMIAGNELPSPPATVAVPAELVARVVAWQQQRTKRDLIKNALVAFAILDDLTDDLAACADAPPQRQQPTCGHASRTPLPDGTGSVCDTCGDGSAEAAVAP